MAQPWHSPARKHRLRSILPLAPFKRCLLSKSPIGRAMVWKSEKELKNWLTPKCVYFYPHHITFEMKNSYWWNPRVGWISWMSHNFVHRNGFKNKQTSNNQSLSKPSMKHRSRRIHQIKKTTSNRQKVWIHQRFAPPGPQRSSLCRSNISSTAASSGGRAASTMNFSLDQSRSLDRWLGKTMKILGEALKHE